MILMSSDVVSSAGVCDGHDILAGGVTTRPTAVVRPIFFIQLLFCVCVCALSQNMADLYEGIVFYTIPYEDMAQPAITAACLSSVDRRAWQAVAAACQ